MPLPTRRVAAWTKGLPDIGGERARVREVQFSDAMSLFEMLTAPEVTRFIPPPPVTLEGFERFIARSHQLRAEQRCACFAVLPHGIDAAVGLIQVRETEPRFQTAGWGFAIGSSFWGTGLFQEAAKLVMRFAFTTLAVHRLEGRSASANGRGNAALRKLGATCEGILRAGFVRNGRAMDQYLWCILDADWISR